LALKDCGEDRDVFKDRIRHTMGLKASASVAPKLLTRTMTMAQYMAVFEHYTRLREQLARKTPKEIAQEPTAETPPTAQPTPAPSEEGPAAVFPVGSSSAREAEGAGPTHVPAGTTDAEAREALVREAVSLGIAEKEARHVVTRHKDLERARSILTAAARKKVQAA
jgi:hypothetical protein